MKLHSLILFRSLLIGLITFSGLNVVAQSNAQLVPTLTPPTPEVSALSKFGTYEVNNFKGLADISIPVHKIVVKDMEVPIVLRYHPSGIKVTDRPGWVGLGWSLDAGGYISRNVMGLPDEQSNGYFNNALDHNIDVYDDIELGYLDDINRGNLDSEPDVFSYSFGANSGQFLLDPLQNSPDASNSVFTGNPSYYTPNRLAEATAACNDDGVMLIPYRPVKIFPTYGTNNLGLEAKDAQGRHYKFEAHERTKDEADARANLNTRSAWKVTEIKSSDESANINFQYTSRYGQVSSDKTYSITVNDQVSSSSDPLVLACTYTPNPGSSSEDNHQIFATEQYLETISYPLGEVRFHLSLDDRPGGFTGQKKLDSITVWSEVASVLVINKTVKFEYGTFTSTDGSGTQRHKLNGVEVLDRNGSRAERYTFDYNTTNNLPDFTSVQRDLWGYFNLRGNQTSSGSPTLIPQQTISYQATSVSSPSNIIIGSVLANGRDPNPNVIQANMLTKIHFPTGGWTEFDYEINQYDDGVGAKDGGGVRVAQIRSKTDAGAAPITKTIKYGVGESGLGYANFLNNNYTFSSEINHRCKDTKTLVWSSFMRSRTFVSTPSIRLVPYDGASVVYPYVTIYEGDETTNAGKSVYEYWYTGDAPGPGFQVGRPTIESYHYKRGQVKSSKMYRNDGGGNYTIVQESNYKYGGFGDCANAAAGLKVKKQIVNETSDVFLGAQHGPEIRDSQSYLFAYYRILRGSDYLLEKEDINYYPSGNVVNLTEYFYDNYDHQQVNSVRTTNSEQEVEEKATLYTPDVTNAVHTQMVARNIVSTPVQETISLDGAFLSQVKWNFHNPVGQVYKPSNITKEYVGALPEAEVSFGGYDEQGNVLEMTTKDGIVTSFIWGYKKQLPVARIVNASNAQLAALNVELSRNSGAISVAELNLIKSGIPGVQITSFSYEPGTGVTSQTDSNGLTTTYLYDGYGRLSKVFDHEGNVLKQYEYHYTSQN